MPYNILKKGATKDWRKVLKETTREDISPRAMMDYLTADDLVKRTKQRPPDRLVAGGIGFSEDDALDNRRRRKHQLLSTRPEVAFHP